MGRGRENGSQEERVWATTRSFVRVWMDYRGLEGLGLYQDRCGSKTQGQHGGLLGTHSRFRLLPLPSECRSHRTASIAQPAWEKDQVWC